MRGRCSEYAYAFALGSVLGLDRGWCSEYAYALRWGQYLASRLRNRVRFFGRSYTAAGLCEVFVHYDIQAN